MAYCIYANMFMVFEFYYKLVQVVLRWCIFYMHKITVNVSYNWILNYIDAEKIREILIRIPRLELFL